MDERFLRNEMLWGKDGQARLTAAHVIVFGLGGVGSYVTECLARAGVGELTLVDSDTVALSNLNRQLEALDSTVGLPKAEAVARQMVKQRYGRIVNLSSVVGPGYQPLCGPASHGDPVQCRQPGTVLPCRLQV